MKYCIWLPFIIVICLVSGVGTAASQCCTNTMALDIDSARTEQFWGDLRPYKHLRVDSGYVPGLVAFRLFDRLHIVLCDPDKQDAACEADYIRLFPDVRIKTFSIGCYQSRFEQKVSEDVVQLPSYDAVYIIQLDSARGDYRLNVLHY